MTYTIYSDHSLKGSNSPAPLRSREMAAQIAGYTDTQNLDGILSKMTQFEYLYAAVRKAHDALLLFMANTPGRYTYRPALCPALRGHQKSPWLPFLGQAPTVDTQLWHKDLQPLPGRFHSSAASSSGAPKRKQSAPHASVPAGQLPAAPTFYWNPAAPCFTSAMGKRSTWKVDRINEKQ